MWGVRPCENLGYVGPRAGRSLYRGLFRNNARVHHNNEIMIWPGEVSHLRCSYVVNRVVGLWFGVFQRLMKVYNEG